MNRFLTLEEKQKGIEEVYTKPYSRMTEAQWRQIFHICQQNIYTFFHLSKIRSLLAKFYPYICVSNQLEPTFNSTSSGTLKSISYISFIRGITPKHPLFRQAATTFSSPG